MVTTVRNKSSKDKNEVHFDDLLTSAGEWGRYQWILFISTCPFFAFGAFAYFSQIFITQTSSNYWCKIPELANMTDIERRDFGIPKDDNAIFGYSQCEMYAANWTEVLATGQKPNQTWNTVPCQHGWEFNMTDIPYPTIGSDLEWVCDKESYQATAQAVFFVGCMFGGVIFGWIADRFGRLPAIISSCCVGCVGGFSSTFARNITEFSAARFVMGMSYDSCIVIAYILILEYIAPKYRTRFANLTFAIFNSLFTLAIPWISLRCGHWKVISLVTSLLLGLGVFTKLILPESPRWLIPQGRVEEAIEKVRTISRINKKEIPTEMINQFKLSVTSAKTEKKQFFLEIFKRPVLRKIFILMCLEYMCSACLNDAVVRCIGLLGYDFFLSYTAICSTICPSVIILAFIMDYTGRRWMCTVTMTLCGIFFILTIFSTTGLQNVIYMSLATLVTNLFYSTLLQWPAEILPTPVRGSGVAIVHVCGYIGTVMSPYIVYLQVYYHWLPFALFGVISGLGMAVSFTLPETAMRSMPNTFEEAEELTKNQKIWSLPFLKARKEKDQVGQTNLSFEFE